MCKLLEVSIQRCLVDWEVYNEHDEVGSRVVHDDE